MRNLKSILAAFAAASSFFAAPVAAQERSPFEDFFEDLNTPKKEIFTIDQFYLFDPEEDPMDLFIPGADDWISAMHLLVPVPTNYMAWDLCGLDETNYVGAGPCFVPVVEIADGNLVRAVASYIDENGRAWVNPTALTNLFLEGGIQSYATDYFRAYAEFAQDEAWPSNMQLTFEEKAWHIEVTPEQWADVCDLVKGEFLPVAVTATYEGDKLISMYGPVCYAYMKPTPYQQALNVKMGMPADSELAVLGGVLADGTPFVDYSLLEHNGLLDKDILVNEVPVSLRSYLNCRSSFPITAGNGETYLVEDTRKACQPGSPANADNMDAPPPFIALLGS